eukprot:369521-Hanusia_phi.AAC.1
MHRRCVEKHFVSSRGTSTVTTGKTWSKCGCCWLEAGSTAPSSKLGRAAAAAADAVATAAKRTAAPGGEGEG